LEWSFSAALPLREWNLKPNASLANAEVIDWRLAKKTH
jgi:hypothetical protein